MTAISFELKTYPSKSPFGPSVEPYAFLYFMLGKIQNRVAVKIGFSHYPQRRAVQVAYNVGAPVELLTQVPCPLDRIRFNEKALHRRFAYAHIQGEWFEPVAELLEMIDRLRGPK